MVYRHITLKEFLASPTKVMFTIVLGIMVGSIWLIALVEPLISILIAPMFIAGMLYLYKQYQPTTEEYQFIENI